MYTTRFCPYCVKARTILNDKGWAFEDIEVDGHPALRAEMIKMSGRYTVPQIWIGEQHIGGCDELHHLVISGQLEGLVRGVANE